jgi:hypothetical protein
MSYPTDPYAMQRRQIQDSMFDMAMRSPSFKYDKRQIEQTIDEIRKLDGDQSTWTHCDKCDGSGEYVNERKGTWGICYQCTGKGQQSERDRRRNWGYMRRHELEACA